MLDWDPHLCGQVDDLKRTVLTIRSQLSRLGTASSEIQLSWALGEIPLSAANAADNTNLDKYFSGLQQIFPTLSYIYFGFTSGDLVTQKPLAWYSGLLTQIGASYFSTNVLSVGVRSSSTSNKWIDYGTNTDGTRSSALYDYGAYVAPLVSLLSNLLGYYNAVMRAWYIGGAYKDKAGSSYNSGLYHDVYQWSGSR